MDVANFMVQVEKRGKCRYVHEAAGSSRLERSGYASKCRCAGDAMGLQWAGISCRRSRQWIGVPLRDASYIQRELLTLAHRPTGAIPVRSVA